MKYRIPETIIIEQNDTETVKDIVFKELDEQEFLVELLKNPQMPYWATAEDGTRSYYKNGKLLATVKGSTVINHYFNN